MATKTTSKKKVAKRAPAKKAAPKTESNGALIPLKKVCAELGIEANCATRAKLRRAWRDDEDARIKPADHVFKKRWDLTPAQAKRAKEILAPAE